jgi:hypothetical protein
MALKIVHRLIARKAHSRPDPYMIVRRLGKASLSPKPDSSNWGDNNIDGSDESLGTRRRQKGFVSGVTVIIFLSERTNDINATSDQLKTALAKIRISYGLHARATAFVISGSGHLLKVTHASKQTNKTCPTINAKGTELLKGPNSRKVSSGYIIRDSVSLCNSY